MARFYSGVAAPAATSLAQCYAGAVAHFYAGVDTKDEKPEKQRKKGVKSMDNVYDVSLDDLLANEIRKGEILPIGKAGSTDEALELLRELANGVDGVEQEDDPANPGQTAYFATYK